MCSSRASIRSGRLPDRRNPRPPTRPCWLGQALIAWAPHRRDHRRYYPDRMHDETRVDGRPRAAGRLSALGAAPLLFVLIYLIWGFTYVAVRIGLRDVGPLTLASVRSLIAAIGLGTVALALRRPLPS